MIKAKIVDYRVSCSDDSPLRALVPESVLTDGEKIKPMLNRRLSSLGKRTVALMNELAVDDRLPVVWLSRYGDLARTARLMNSVARSEPLSPIDFSLSVQNAEPGIYSIATEDEQPIVAMSCVKYRAYSAFLEAYGIMREQQADVLIVFAEQSIPDEYRKVTTSEVEDVAIVVRLTHTDADHLKLSELRNLDDEQNFESFLRWLVDHSEP